MKKQGSVFIEGLTVFLVILCCIFISLPFLVKNHQKEKDIVKWSQKFSNIRYAFAVVQAQSAGEDFMSDAFKHKLKTFLRVKQPANPKYKQNFVNRKLENPTYKFDKFYENEDDAIFGFKWINPKCELNEICAVMSVDINGYYVPNTWGMDVFGVNFYKDRVEPIGQEKSLKELKKDCSKSGTGVYCSAYYLIGGLIDK